MDGFVHVYTGDGKGKTTAAIGLAIRAAGAGLKVYIAQFIKMGEYSEIKALKRYSDLITVEQFGLGRFTDGKPLPEELKERLFRSRQFQKALFLVRQLEYALCDLRLHLEYDPDNPADPQEVLRDIR